MRSLLVCHDRAVRDALLRTASEQDLVSWPFHNLCGVGFKHIVFVDSPVSTAPLAAGYEEWVRDIKARLLPGGSVINDPTHTD